MKRIVFKKAIVIVLVCAMVVTGGLADNSIVNAAPKPTSLTLSAKKATLYTGELLTLSVKSVKPKKASKVVTWKTSNKKVATVTKKGVVKAVSRKNGKATITATSKTNKRVKATCRITVKKGVVNKSISVNPKSATLNVGATRKINVSWSPKNTSSKKLSWKTNNKNVATVNKNGLVTARKAGSANITATNTYGKKAVCRVTVQDASTPAPETPAPVPATTAPGPVTDAPVTETPKDPTPTPGTMTPSPTPGSVTPTPTPGAETPTPTPEAKTIKVSFDGTGAGDYTHNVYVNYQLPDGKSAANITNISFMLDTAESLAMRVYAAPNNASKASLASDPGPLWTFSSSGSNGEAVSQDVTGNAILAAITGNTVSFGIYAHAAGASQKYLFYDLKVTIDGTVYEVPLNSSTIGVTGGTFEIIEGGSDITPPPPTDTPAPPTDTPAPPTDTPAPPTDTPVPSGRPDVPDKPDTEFEEVTPNVVDGMCVYNVAKDSQFKVTANKIQIGGQALDAPEIILSAAFIEWLEGFKSGGLDGLLEKWEGTDYFAFSTKMDWIETEGKYLWIEIHTVNGDKVLTIESEDESFAADYKITFEENEGAYALTIGETSDPVLSATMTEEDGTISIEAQLRRFAGKAYVCTIESSDEGTVIEVKEDGAVIALLDGTDSDDYVLKLATDRVDLYGLKVYAEVGGADATPEPSEEPTEEPAPANIVVSDFSTASSVDGATNQGGNSWLVNEGYKSVKFELPEAIDYKTHPVMVINGTNVNNFTLKFFNEANTEIAGTIQYGNSFADGSYRTVIPTSKLKYVAFDSGQTTNLSITIDSIVFLKEEGVKVTDFSNGYKGLEWCNPTYAQGTWTVPMGYHSVKFDLPSVIDTNECPTVIVRGIIAATDITSSYYGIVFYDEDGAIIESATKYLPTTSHATEIELPADKKIKNFHLQSNDVTGFTFNLESVLFAAKQNLEPEPTPEPTPEPSEEPPVNKDLVVKASEIKNGNGELVEMDGELAKITKQYGFAYSYNKFDLVIPAGKTLADYETVTFSFTGVSGDYTWKDIRLLVLDPSNIGTGNEVKDVAKAQISNTQQVGKSGANVAENVTLTIDATKTAALSGTVSLSVYLPAYAYESDDNTKPATVYKISDLTFKAKEVEPTPEPSEEPPVNKDLVIKASEIKNGNGELVEMDGELAKITKQYGFAYSYNKFNLVIPEGKTLADYEKVTFSFTGVSGDYTWKDIRLLVLDPSNIGTGNEVKDVAKAQISNTQQVGKSGANVAENVTLTIDATKAAALSGTVSLSVYLPAYAYESDDNTKPATVYKLSDLTFQAKEVESTPEPSEEPEITDEGLVLRTVQDGNGRGSALEITLLDGKTFANAKYLQADIYYEQSSTLYQPRVYASNTHGKVSKTVADTSTSGLGDSCTRVSSTDFSSGLNFAKGSWINAKIDVRENGDLDKFTGNTADFSIYLHNSGDFKVKNIRLLDENSEVIGKPTLIDDGEGNTSFKYYTYGSGVTAEVLEEINYQVPKSTNENEFYLDLNKYNTAGSGSGVPEAVISKNDVTFKVTSANNKIMIALTDDQIDKVISSNPTQLIFDVQGTSSESLKFRYCFANTAGSNWNGMTNLPESDSVTVFNTTGFRFTAFSDNPPNRAKFSHFLLHYRGGTLPADVKIQSIKITVVPNN